jgi:adenylate kinase
MVVILLGPPGVGKGTQGSLLERELGWVRIATGDLLREARRAGTELGRKAQAFMDAGELVPDDLIVALMKETLEGLSPDRGVLLDGFPRTVPQAKALEAMLPEVRRRLDAVVLLEAPAEVLLKRISGRRSCPVSGRIYNIYFDPPRVEGVCDESGLPLVHREDDQPETVARRLRVYADLTEPLVAHYEEGEVPLLRIEGDGALDDVRAAIRSGLSQVLGIRGEAV